MRRTDGARPSRGRDFLSGGQTSEQATANLNAEGLQVKVKGTTTSVKADAQLELEAGAIASLKGTLVKIN